MERIWIYQSDRKLTDSEENWLYSALQAFVQQWNSHGTSLAASAEIRHQIFVILKVDDQQTSASGCSIDSSVHFLKKVEEHLNISLFDRMHVAYQDANKQYVTVSKKQFENLLATGEVNQDTLVFNNLIQTYAQLETDWLIPLSASWHAKVFGNATYNA